MVNRAKRGLLSSLIPSAHRLLQSGAGLSPKAVAGIQPDAIIALLNGKNSSLRYYTNNIFKISPLNDSYSLSLRHRHRDNAAVSAITVTSW